MRHKIGIALINRQEGAATCEVGLCFVHGFAFSLLIYTVTLP